MYTDVQQRMLLALKNISYLESFSVVFKSANISEISRNYNSLYSTDLAPNILHNNSTKIIKIITQLEDETKIELTDVIIFKMEIAVVQR